MLPRSRLPLIVAAACAAALLGVFSALMIADRGPSAGAEAAGPGRGGAPVRVSGEATIGGPFTLVTHEGETVTNEDFKGRPLLIYFGFTYCPDICPMSLQSLAAALDEMPERQAERFQSVLITIDPERDTPEHLARYVDSPAFPDGLIGLTGTPEQIAEAARAYRVYYAKVEDDGTMADYLMDHTSLIYLMDSEGEFVDVFAHGTTPAQIAARLQRFLREGAA